MAAVISSHSLSSPKSKHGRGQRKSSSLPAETVEYLKAWMMSPEHIAHPYPTEQEKAQIMVDTGIELKQLTNWFVNNRKRYWKPRVEARLQQQAQAAAAAASAQAAVMAAAVSASQASPVSPDTPFKSTLNLTVNRYSTFDLPRSHGQAAGPEQSHILSTSESSTSLHLVSETSSSASVAPSETETSTAGEDLDAEILAQDDLVEAHPNHPSEVQTSGQASSQDRPSRTLTGKRSRENDPLGKSLSGSRKEFRVASPDTWKSACREATTAYCKSLPTLDEATRLFGYGT